MRTNFHKMSILLVSTVMLGQNMPGPSGPASVPPSATNKDVNSPPKKLQAVHARKLDGFELSPQPTNNGTQIAGASRGIGTATTLRAPRKGRAYTLHPLFQWTNANPKIASFRFRLLAPDQNTVIYQTEIVGSSLKYPADAPPLIPGGDYFWTVQPSVSLLGDAAEPAELVILSAPQRSELNRLLGSSSEEGRAQVFVEKRFWYDAIEAYTQMISTQPENSQHLRKRAEIYEQLPQTKEAAEQDLARADHPH